MAVDADALLPATTPPAPRGARVSQSDFDAQVVENMETFEMSAEEAVESTLEELALQKVDVSAICKVPDGANAREALPVVKAFRALEAACPQGAPLPGTAAAADAPKVDADTLRAACETLRAAIADVAEEDERTNVLSIAADCGLPGCALYACRCAAATGDPATLAAATTLARAQGP